MGYRELSMAMDGLRGDGPLVNLQLVVHNDEAARPDTPSSATSSTAATVR